MSNDNQPAPAGGADGSNAGIPPQSAVPAPADKSSDGTATTRSADTTTHDQQATDRVEFLRDLGIEPEAAAGGDEAATDKLADQPQETERKPEDPPTGDQPQDGDQKPDDQPLKPEQEQQLHSFGRKRIKNLERQTAAQAEELKILRTKVEQSTEAVRGAEALHEVAVQAGFNEGPRAVEAMVLMGRAINGKDPEALAEIGSRLLAAGWAPPVSTTPSAQPTATTPAKLDDEAERIIAEVAEFQGPEAADKIRARLAPKAQPQPAEPTKPAAQPVAQPSPVERSAQQAIAAKAVEIRAQLKDAAPALLKEITDRVIKADQDRFNEEGQGLPPQVWAKVFEREAEAVLARHRQQSQRKAPTSARPTAPSSASKGSIIDELSNE